VPLHYTENTLEGPKISTKQGKKSVCSFRRATALFLRLPLGGGIGGKKGGGAGRVALFCEADAKKVIESTAKVMIQEDWEN